MKPRVALACSLVKWVLETCTVHFAAGWFSQIFIYQNCHLKDCGKNNSQFSSVQFSRSSCPTLCDPMNCSTPGLPVHHQLPEFTQTHVHRVGDAIQPSHPLSFPSPPAPLVTGHNPRKATLSPFYSINTHCPLWFRYCFRSYDYSHRDGRS